MAALSGPVAGSVSVVAASGSSRTGSPAVSIGAGVNGQSATNPRYESSQDADGFNAAYLVADLTLGYRTKIFGRDVSYALNCNNLFDRLYYKGQFSYGEPRKITFRTDFSF